MTTNIFQMINAEASKVEKIEVDLDTHKKRVERYQSDGNKSNFLIYCDPPYKSAGDRGKYRKEPDYNRFAEVIGQIESYHKIAISGYNDDYDSLGWVKSQYLTRTSVNFKSKKQSKRIECLWTNYQPAQQTLNFGVEAH